ncbi:MAG: hypothetical protein KF900_07585 [Bacteroidetes bacterium]|nr:hypothetical protein [Bacteroidota bacterium]
MFFLSLALQAQYGNGWINYSQQYFKIPIFKEGIYRIDSTTLANYYNLSTVNPKNFQLFLKGKEQFLYIKGESDNQFNSDDYLEFYANPAMREADSAIYSNINYLPNPYVSLFNDTVYAFLTLTTSENNKRYVLETDTNSAAYPAAAHFYSEKIYSVKHTYNTVGEYHEGVSNPRYTQAEGWGLPFNKGASVSANFTALNSYTAANLSAIITVNYSGMSFNSSVQNDHQIQLSYTTQGNTPVIFSDTLFRGFVPVRKRLTLNAQNLNDALTVSLASAANAEFAEFNNSTLLHYIHVFYPQTLNLNNEPFCKAVINNHTNASKSFFNFQNFNYPGAVLLDVSNGKRMTAVKQGAQLRAVIPNGAVNNKLCVLSAETQIIPVTTLIKANENGTFTNFKNFSGTKPYVIIYHKSLQASAMAYRNYRQSAAGGGYHVITADVQELYEQFAYGINKHPLSIRNFAKFLKDSLAHQPNYFFLIGKGIEVSNLGAATQVQNLVPTMGVPSCDNLLLSGLSQNDTAFFAPDMPLGRLAALTNDEVITYLTKVQQHESTGAAEWKKRVLHFVGGDTPELINSISNYMSLYKEVISNDFFGGDVLTFNKNSVAPIETNVSDSVKNAVNAGCAVFNFFGHGSTDNFDWAIDNPDMFNNKDKYPFVVSNSCYSGNVHLFNHAAVSNRFVFASQKGSVGFLATTSLAFDYALHNYCAQFYTALSYSKYNQGVGDMVKEASRNNSAANDMLMKFVGLNVTLHGDPAIKISNGALPDYSLNNSDVLFDLKTYTDSVGVIINYKNLGAAPNDTFSVRIERFYANGDSVSVLKRTRAATFKSSIKFFMPLDFNRGIGLNYFTAKLDYYNDINESNELNNATNGKIELFIPGGDIMPVYPFKYAVVPKTNTITLKASTTDPFAPRTSYRFQLDTCDKFLSPIQTTLMTSTGGVLEWNVKLPFADSTVYFWRVSRDSVSPQQSFSWKETSFQTIGEKRGWAQAHFHQFKNNAYQYVQYNKNLRQFVFHNNQHSVMCRSGIFPYLGMPAFNYYFNAELKEGWSSAFDGWNFAVFDSITGKPQYLRCDNFPNTCSGTFNNCIEHGERYVYSFGNWSACGSPSTWQTDIENFLNAVPQNNYVLAYTTGANLAGNTKYSQLSTYSNSLYSAFASIGANIQNVPDTVACILFGKKGMSAGQGHLVSGVNKQAIITLEDTIKTRWNSGYIASEIIGPSSKWNSLHWQVKSLEAGAGDTTVLKLVGIRANGQQDTLKAFPVDSANVLALYNYADAKIYPFLKLVALMKDNAFRTSPQLKRWQVLYEEAPECAINPLKGFKSINDSLQEGDNVTFHFPIENVGEKTFTDSLVVTYWIEDNNRNKTVLPQKMKAAGFAPHQVLIDTVKINSYQLQGNNALWIYVNPVQNAKYQHEQHQFNNIGRYAFNVRGDITNPLLDVTFDGVRILNGDIVSAKPNILITLKDENKFLALNDTSAFAVYLQAPNQGTRQRIYFAQGLQFTPAQLPKNSCSILYNPSLVVDGKYTLSVQARDRSNNTSGASDYSIQFEIQNKPTVTNVVNYPNPFTTSTRFVFTLTGSEVPEVFTIRIMTITGKIVREITRSELGYIHIGKNISEYAWDGRDNFGDRLANGVYLYHVITKLNGSHVEHNATSADKYFRKEFGKMVIMR